ncbi:MAG: methyltransferase domain-containing protein [Candidatus Eisenbacteria bacterium]|nr:methyltransferase domain-containing protein [Candidatus Eisenbacteria bacterium]
MSSSREGREERVAEPRDVPESAVFWERRFVERLSEGLPDEWRTSVFDGDSALAARFLEELEPGASVLDFGCGFGRNSLGLAERGFQVLACDLAESAVEHCIEQADREGLEVERVRCREATLELPDEAVDGVLAWSVLDHVRLADAERIARELGRVARDDALLLFSFDEDRSDDPESVGEELDDGTFRYTRGRRRGMLFRPYTNAEIKGLFEREWKELGFEGPDMTVHRRGLMRRRLRRSESREA